MANAIFRVLVNGAWVDIPVVQGTDGVSVALRVSGDYLQMKQSDQTEWTTIFDFSTIETVKGDPGEPGADGTDGADGVGISGITLSPVGNNYVLTFTLTDSTTRTVSFPKPTNGTNGYTPVRGTDYWTQADIDAMHQYIDDQILGGAW